jgi:hypothetical protein
MTIQTKILLVNAALTAGATAGLAFATDTFPGNGFFFMFGLIGIIGGLGCLALGLLLLLRRDKSVAKGYLVSGGLLLVIGLVGYFLLNKY